MLKLKKVKIIKSKREIFLIFDKNQEVLMTPFGLTIFTVTTPLIVKESLVEVKNVFLRSSYFYNKDPQKEDVNKLKQQLVSFLNTNFREYGELK